MRRVFSFLPGLAFFVVLAAAAAIGYWFGTQAAPAAAGGEAATVYTCSMHPQVRQDQPGQCPICHMELVPLDRIADDGPGIRIDPRIVQNMGVRVAPVEQVVLTRSLRAFAVVRDAEPRQRDIALKVNGFVESLAAHTVGMTIHRGDPLFELYAPALVVAQEELIAAARSGDAELIASARRKLQLWDVPDDVVDAIQASPTARRTLTWTSPVDGVLVRRDVVEGAPVRADTPLLRIVDRSVLWLDAQVPEGRLGDVTLGLAAQATFAALPGVTVDGSVVFVDPDVDPTSRTAIVRVELASPDPVLRPGMFARLAIALPSGAPVVAIPAAAVLDSGTRQVAWITAGDGRFEPRSLRLGRTDDAGRVEVLAGLAPGEHVVTSGQFLIDAESRLRDGMQKQGDDGLLGPDGQLPLPDATALDATQQDAIDTAVRAYLAVATEFANDRDTADGWTALHSAAHALLALALPDGAGAAAQRFADALDVPTANLASRRTALIAVSDALIALVGHARPSATFGDALFVMHCPMVEASWLQTTPALRNPYYGSEMLECGEETAQIPLRNGGGR